MQYLKERTEIAQAVNYKRYPTVIIDLAKTDDYGIVGTKVCIDNGFFKSGEPYYVRATLRAYNDDHRLSFHSYGCCIHSSFGYHDLVEMYEYVNVPVIKPDQEILVCVIDSEARTGYAPVVLRTGKRVDPHCSTPLTLEEHRVFWKEEEK